MTTDPSDGEGDGADKYAGWYEGTDILWQGSILRNIRVFEETAESTSEELNVAVRLIDAVVLTQSCDIPKDAQSRLLVAEVQSYANIASSRGDRYKATRYRTELIDGLSVSEFLLPPSTGVLDDWSVVNFRELYTPDRDKVASSADGFVGLASPYREHLGQAFARFMMRVGLPTGLFDFKQYKFDA
jgi:hypothetical protein